MSIELWERELESIKRELMNKPKEELVDLLAYILWASQRIDPNPIMLCFWIGRYFEVVNRRYESIIGRLDGIVLSFEKYRLTIVQDRKDWSTGQIIHEEKTITIDANMTISAGPVWELEVKGEEQK